MIGDTLRLSIGLAMKDARLYVRDKLGLALGFLLPIALVAVFAGVFGSMASSGDGGKLPKLSIRVADEDGTDASRELVDTLNGSEIADARPRDGSGAAYTRERVLADVKDGDYALALVIPKGFSETIARGEMPSLELVRDASKSVEKQIATQAVFQGLMAAFGEELGRAMATRGIRELGSGFGLDPAAVASAEAMAKSFFDFLGKSIDEREAAGEPDGDGEEAFEFGGMGSMMALVDTPVGGEHIDKSERSRVYGVSQSVAGTAVMMVLFGLVACGGTLLREREEGTLRRLLLTPAPRQAILWGKFLFTFAVGLVQLVVMFAFGAIVFSLPVGGHLAGLLLVSVALCAAATGFGVFIATVGRTQKQVEGFSTLIILVMSAVGGSWFPLVAEIGVPQWMITASHFTLNAWAMDAYRDLFWFDRGVLAVVPEVLVLLGIAAILSALSAALFRRRFASAEGG
jgi:ABC-2 type transport system permease protein